ncbi:MAG: hypothetical protein H7338_07480 [Candidatus Sericytochromatia bacterium]|nr:hypothetical protein [Candidatus Sericytochromatia bacterium]
MRALSTLLFASAVVLSAASELPATHMTDVTGRWHEHGNAANLMTVSPAHLVIADKDRVTVFDLQSVTERPGEVEIGTTFQGKPLKFTVRPSTRDKAVFDFQGDASTMDRLMPQGQGAGDQMVGKWYLRVPNVPQSASMAIEFTADELITTAPGGQPAGEPLTVSAETAVSLTTKSGEDTVVFTLQGSELVMRINGKPDLYTFSRS